MKLTHIFVLLFFMLSHFLFAQNMKDYNGNWKGMVESETAFSLPIEIEFPQSNTGVFRLSNANFKIEKAFDIIPDKPIRVQITDNTSFVGYQSEDGLRGFVRSGMLFCHIDFTKKSNDKYEGSWNMLFVDKLKSRTLYLSVEEGSEDDYQAYPFFADSRFTGTWCGNFQKEGDKLRFFDLKIGLNFEGKLLGNAIELEIRLGDHIISKVSLEKYNQDWSFSKFADEEFDFSEEADLRKLESLIVKDSLINTHSVLISQKGEMIYEKYFHGYNQNLPHDTRSGSKSISSAIVGIAKRKKLFENTNQSLFDFLPAKYQVYKDSLKSAIDLQSLLTMSSGLDAIDFGIKRNSVASEDSYQPTPDWFETILKAPMIYKPNTHANYGSANPALLGLAVDYMISEPLELFMDKNLFQKLGISNYVIQSNAKELPYFGGGMYLTPRDMVKFGNLYLNKGKTESETILTKKWVKDSFQNYRVLENTDDKNGYGYLWWHHTYEVNGKNISTIEARGAGGQYIFVIPSLKSVVVITSGNYRNSK